jgi:hypothetical protein
MYGVEQGSVRAERVQLSPEGVSYHALIGEQQYDIICQLPGIHT